jgi:hypothetical protein
MQKEKMTKGSEAFWGRKRKGPCDDEVRRELFSRGGLAGGLWRVDISIPLALATTK